MLHWGLTKQQLTFSCRKDPSAFFSFPVTDLIAPGYSTIIKRPMDFGAMKEKVKNEYYESPEELKVHLSAALPSWQITFRIALFSCLILKQWIDWQSSLKCWLNRKLMLNICRVQWLTAVCLHWYRWTSGSCVRMLWSTTSQRPFTTKLPGSCSSLAWRSSAR